MKVSLACRYWLLISILKYEYSEPHEGRCAGLWIDSDNAYKMAKPEVEKGHEMVSANTKFSASLAIGNDGKDD